jgi:cytochrome c oxidase assembly protein subunit 15
MAAAARLFCRKLRLRLTPRNTTTSPWLNRFAVFTAAATLALLGAGGLVTSHGVGMAVPDWPNTYGYNMFLFPISQWVGGIFYEHSHRLIAALVGLLTAILAAWLWIRETRGRSRWLGLCAIVFVLVLLGIRKMPVYVSLAGAGIVAIGFGLYQFGKNTRQLRWLGMVALAAVIVQGVLGGLRVVLYQDEIGIFHATLAQVFFVLICAIALLTSRWWTALPSPLIPLLSDGRAEQPSVAFRGLKSLALATTVLILLQLILGATMRHQHAGLAIPDFPLAYGKLWPAMDANSVASCNQQRLEVTAANPITPFQIGLQMAHRLVAVAILICVAAVAWQAQRWSSRFSVPPNKLMLELRRAGSETGAPLRRLATAWLALIFVQAGLGAWTIWSNKAADVATAHVLVGALSLVTGALWCIIAFRRLPGTSEAKSVLRGETVDESVREFARAGDSFHGNPATAMNK